MHKLNNVRPWFFLIFGIILLIYSYVYVDSFTQKNVLTSSRESIQQKIIIQENSLKDELTRFTNQLKTNIVFSPTQNLFEFSPSKENSFFVYQNDSLIYWTTNVVPLPTFYVDSLASHPLVSLLNGWYLCKVYKYKAYTTVGLSLVKQHFVYENNYLQNTFNPLYKVDPSVQLSLDSTNCAVFNTQKRFLFSLFIDEDKIHLDFAALIFLFLLFASVLLLTSSVALFIKKQFSTPSFFPFAYYLILSLFFVSVPFIFGIGNHYPSFLYQSKLFSPIYFASSAYLPSLGYLLIDTLILLMVVFSVKQVITSYPKSVSLPLWFRKFGLFLLLAVQFCFFGLVFYLIKTVVLNSSLSFSNESIFNYTYLHYLVYLIFGICLFLFVYLTSSFVRIAFYLEDKKTYFWFSFTFILTLFTFVNYTFFRQYEHLLFYFVGYYAIIAVLYFFEISFSKSAVKILFLLLFSFFIAQSIESFYITKEHNERLLIAEKLGTQHDPIAEYQLKEITTLLANDPFVRQFGQNIDKDEVRFLDYLNKMYFNTFSNKYKISVTLCKQNQILKLQPDNYKIECGLYFDRKIASVGSLTTVDNLWFMNYQPGLVSYLLVMGLPNGVNTTSKITLYIELDSKILVTESGYPELLIDNKQKGISKDFSKYTYARYLNSDLINQYGKYSYSQKLSFYRSFLVNNSFFDYEGYNHLFYSFSNKESILLSKRIPTLLERSATVSFYFLFYGFILLIISSITYNPMVLIKSRFSFRLRMQFYMISIILISFVLVGSVTINYFLTLNQRKNIEFVNEKIHSIFLKLESQIPAQTPLSDASISIINQLVYQFSAQYFADINVYDSKGQLIATSRPSLFQQGLLKDKMNREALNQFIKSRKTIYFHDEFIGKQKYWSVYMPYFSSNGEVLMYINMPYFAKQKDLNQEISSFVVTFLSVYIFIILITILIALILARYISRPLLLIKERMSNIQLGNKNEKISWQSTDEIGKLVEVYNHMVDELRISADLLASSQREQAWREMAQQVAHEIKNPLTPMKLSVQMLERTYKKGDPLWEERLTSFAKTLVEQIDSLADIATSFSDFAKMPKGTFAHEDLLEIVRSLLMLHTYSGLELNLSTDNLTSYPVLVDKNQLIRVFNNLIKNAVQSINADFGGQIHLSISSYDAKFWLVCVSDNGSGISEEVKDRIFSPNFTTKTSGMGLGLAMVKNIIVDFGGEIWFTSEEGNGASFYFTIPKIEDK